MRAPFDKLCTVSLDNGLSAVVYHPSYSDACYAFSLNGSDITVALVATCVTVNGEDLTEDVVKHMRYADVMKLSKIIANSISN